MLADGDDDDDEVHGNSVLEGGRVEVSVLYE